MDNFAVRKLPLSSSLGLEYLLNSGLDGEESSLTADPDGDGLDNFGEWAFGTDPTKSDRIVSATSLVLANPQAGILQFAYRRLAGFAAAGLNYRYMVSSDLVSWQEASTSEQSATPLPATPGYENVTVSLQADELGEEDQLFLKIIAEP